MVDNLNWKVLVFLGIPGSGKGTQAQLLAQNPLYIHISTGQLFRKLDADPFATEEDKNLLHGMKDGQLVPDYLVYKMTFHAIDEALKEGKIPILDGAIRSFDQAKAFEHYFESRGIADAVAVVEINISDELGLMRLTCRKVCSSCGYIIPYSPENFKKDLCEVCGGILEVRKDDNPEIVEKRITSQGNMMLAPIVDYYKNVGHVFVVDGSQSILKVDADVREVLRIGLE